jgi:D-glycero-D-manno-heptose 1,7-bisphosphate phosphatase
LKRAVFLDRDGTLIELVHHLADPAKVRLLPRAGQAVKALRDAGFTCVLVTNQSAIGRGLLTVEGLGEVHAEVLRQLAEEGTTVDGHYYCPLEPRVKNPRVVEHPDRKPGPGMLLRASAELGLEITRSVMVGDTLSDLLAGRNAGCERTILVRTGYGKDLLDHEGAADLEADDLWAASRLILTLDDRGRK